MNDLSSRLFEFAVNCIEFSKTVTITKEIEVVIYQLSKSCTSPGANYEESQASSSKADFRNKVFISLKEMREANYWLRICKRLKLGNDNRIDQLIDESEQLKKILGSIVSKIQH
ncbi:MAG: four helix bundle protein [Melioribacteraceae bacterium]|nr:four helix bundle protein [Melioribacteraceae bacterium]MCF8263505.1 four helix bundle protein [Melioribacteraceae bacterium]MCF8296941.1 four helix bundle protein [Saprospiraceae bacterium]